MKSKSLKSQRCDSSCLTVWYLVKPFSFLRHQKPTWRVPFYLGFLPSHTEKSWLHRSLEIKYINRKQLVMIRLRGLFRDPFPWKGVPPPCVCATVVLWHPSAVGGLLHLFAHWEQAKTHYIRSTQCSRDTCFPCRGTLQTACVHADCKGAEWGGLQRHFNRLSGWNSTYLELHAAFKDRVRWKILFFWVLKWFMWGFTDDGPHI